MYLLVKLLVINKFKPMKRLLILVVLLGLTSTMSAQHYGFVPSERYIVTVSSSNGHYHAKSVPAQRLDYSPFGETKVYDARSGEQLYTIPACLAEGYTFVSDDGQTVLHLFYYDHKHGKAVTFYHKGNMVRQIKVKDFLSNDTSRVLFFSEDSITYATADGKISSEPRIATSERNKLIKGCPAFAVNDTVFVYTSTHKLVRIHLSTQQIDTLPFGYHSDTQLRQMLPESQLTPDWTKHQHNNIVEVKQFKCPDDYAKIDGDYDEAVKIFAKKMRMVAYDEEDRKNWRYKYYYVNMLLKVDRQGEATIFKIENRDSLPETDLRKAVSKMLFDVDFPDGIDFWYKQLNCKIRKRNKIVARCEGTIQRRNDSIQRRIRYEAESIDGVYIPRNLEECFHVLDTMLHPSDRNTIKAESRDGMSKYHFSLGLWMRNNWGLWGGSRLQTYLYRRGLHHPDDMSGEVLRFYNDYLWGRDSAWRAFDTTLVPPDTATEALPQYHIADRQLKKILNRIIDGKSFRFPDENNPLDEYDHCFIEFTPLTINDSTNNELVNELVDFFNDTTEKYTDLSCSKQPLKYPLSLQKPFICLTVSKINSFDDFNDRPSIGYIYYRKHYFMLTSGNDFKTINNIETGISAENAESNFSQFLKPTNKSRRFWKPKKYHHRKWPEPYRGYIYQEGRWYIIEER